MNFKRLRNLEQNERRKKRCEKMEKVVVVSISAMLILCYVEKVVLGIDKYVRDADWEFENHLYCIEVCGKSL